MMTEDDRDAIEGLFARLDRLAGRGGTPEPEAAALIRARLAERPAAAYHLAQTVIVQEEALSRSADRIAELEAELAEAAAPRRDSGGFFGSLFGSTPRPGRREMQHSPLAAAQGGGFLAGAAQTALGITGGVLLGNAIAGMLDGGPEAGDPDPGDGDFDGDFGDGDI